MEYDTPLHLQALRDFVLNDYRIGTVNIGEPIPEPTSEDIAMVRGRAERMRDFMQRVNLRHVRYHHEQKPQIREVPAAYSRAREHELVSA